MRTDVTGAIGGAAGEKGENWGDWWWMVVDGGGKWGMVART